MPLDIEEIKELDIAAVRTQTMGGVDWDGLFEALTALGFGEDEKGFSVGDVHLMTRQFATVEYPSDGYPISRQRVYRWVTDLYKKNQAIRFTHPNAKDHRFVFSEEKLDSSNKQLEDYLYQGE